MITALVIIIVALMYFSYRSARDHDFTLNRVKAINVLLQSSLSKIVEQQSEITNLSADNNRLTTDNNKLIADNDKLQAELRSIKVRNNGGN